MEYMRVADLFHWAEAMDFTAWFTGEWKRWKRTEYNLPRMVDKGAMVQKKYAKKLVYSVPKKRGGYSGHIHHGTVCTNALLRFKTSKEGNFLPERLFRQIGFGAVPEWAVIFNQIIILFEFSTADNFRRRAIMKKKIDQYRASLPSIESYFEAKGLVLFVIDTPPQMLNPFIQENRIGIEEFHFTDLASFLDVGYGNQLTAPIYLWGGDGKKHPLTDDA